MISLIYIEKEVREHPRTLAILDRYPQAQYVECERYTEIFNRKAQNFRLQKKQPALILARKHDSHVLPAPKQYGIGAEHNYYFSHMLNCLYDCRYCFLQGMLQSAHYVLFVNYEDFISKIEQTIKQHNGEAVHFFSGYDCDSLAMDPVTQFIDAFLPVFEYASDALIELRTKSIQTRALLKRKAIKNCVVAFSFTPDEIATALEHKVPAVKKRLQAIVELQQSGWIIGLRFDPLIYTDNFKQQYNELFSFIFEQLDLSLLHSVSLGSFRLPKNYFKKLEKLYPDDILLTSPKEEKNGSIGYPGKLRSGMLDYCKQIITHYVPADKFFPCHEMI